MIQNGQPAKKGGAAGKVVGLLVAVALLAGCFFGGRALFAADEPMTAEEYRAKLAEADAALAPQAESLKAGDSGPVILALRAQSEKLDEIDPPENAQSAHRLASGSLLALANELENPEETACIAAVPYNDMLRSTSAGSVRVAAKDLLEVDPSFAFGTFLPAEPKLEERRLKNNAFVKKSPGGNGILDVQNAFAGGDTTVSLVKVGAKSATLTVYLRSGDKISIDNVPYGNYEMFTASGEDWDAKKQGFTRDCAFNKFDDEFEFSNSSPGWEVELTQSVGGNASTTDVDPGNFPG